MYEGLGLAGLRTRIEFRRSAPDDDPSMWVRPAELAAKNVAFAYVDADVCDAQDVLNVMAVQLRTDHPPYDLAVNGWLRFMDDLISLSAQRDGLVIIIDNAVNILSDPTSWGFDLIRWWTIQLWHWVEQERPCHLCFQLDQVPEVRLIYGHQ